MTCLSDTGLLYVAQYTGAEDDAFYLSLEEGAESLEKWRFQPDPHTLSRLSSYYTPLHS
jgi:hypothetical protein